ncbi:hypothetical protein [Mycolicibacterium setense]
MTAPRPRPVWCPHDTRKLAEEAARVEPKPKLRDWLWAPVLVFLAILSGLITAPHAKADPVDDATAKYGVPVVCETLDLYPTADGVAGVVIALVEDGYTPGQSAGIIARSVIVFCPEHRPAVEAFVAKYAPQAGRGMAV